MKLRHKLLIAFIILALLPMMVFGMYSYKIASNHIQEKALSFGENVTKDIHTKLNAYIQEAATVTRYMIGDSELEALLNKDYATYRYPLYEKTQDIKQYNYYLNHLMNLYVEMDYALILPLKQPYSIGYSNRGNTFFSGKNEYLDNAWYKKTIEADGYWVYTGLHKEEKINGNPSVISISRLIKDSTTQQPLAVVKIMIDQHSLEDILNLQEKKGDFSFLLLDENNQLIGQSNHYPTNLIDHVNTLPEYLVSQNVSDATGWKVYAAVNKDLLLGELNPIKIGLIWLVIFTILISIFLSYVLSASLVRPIEKLKESMNQIVVGKWDRLAIEERNDEIGDLTKHYNKMLKRLDRYVHLLIEQEKEKKDLEYKSLQAQINPHFLYNTLNTIKWCAYLEEPELVNKMIDSLVFILRFISKRNDDLITMEEETEFLENYLAIMEVRFQDGYTLYWEFSEEIKECKIPILLLQPLVENAIVYGMEKEDGECNIWLRGKVKANRLIIEVEDNGVGFTDEKVVSKGTKFSSVGLKNVKERIKLIYGDEGNMSIKSVPNQGTKVRIELPFHF